ncbi:MAG: hypothetical protein JST13_08345, partial [Bacteroidetes bacterium]|nr:hypothetical protein [Bacteroidota bacterium]
MRIFRYATLFKYPLFAIALACIPCYSLFSQPCNGPTVKPTINISANATTVCSGSLITFIATATNCGASPTYQWKINGISTGANKDTFVTASVNNGDVVSCLLTVDPAFVCASPAKVSSYGIVMTVSPSQAPTITIAASANDICPGSSVTFNSKTESTGANLSFQWKLNGKNVSSKPAFVTNALVNGDEVYCMLVDSGGCSTTPVPSNKITISVKDIPSIVLTPTDTTVEAGSSVRLNAAVSGNLQSYNWQPSSGLTGAGSLSPITLPVFSPAVYYFDAVTTDGCSINKKVS